MLSTNFVKLAAVCAVLAPFASATYSVTYSAYDSDFYILNPVTCVATTADQTGTFKTGTVSASGTCQDIKPAYAAMFKYDGPPPGSCTLNVYTQPNCEAGLAYPGLKRSITFVPIEQYGCLAINVANTTSGVNEPAKSMQMVCSS